MPFEPQLPSAYQYLFHGHIETQVTDPNGVPAATIISLTDTWRLKVDWQVHGVFVPFIGGGTWKVRAYLESIGRGPEGIVASQDVPMDGRNNYSVTFNIGPNVPRREGPYKLVTTITAESSNNVPAPFAGYDEGPILQFYSGSSLPPTPPTP